MATIEHRKLTLVNLDPLGRCYNGVFPKAEWQWTAWSELETGWSAEVAERRLEFWRGLTAYAVKERGKSATAEYRVVS